MATQVMGQSGGSSLFPGNTNLGMALSNDMYDFPELSKAELAAPQLIMLANVALTGEVNGNCCDYLVGEERQMAELTTVGNTNFSDSDGEGIDDVQGVESDHEDLEGMELGALRAPEASNVETAGLTESSVPHLCRPEKGSLLEVPDAPESADDKCKSLKNKPFRCKPCQYEAESEEEFVHHIRVHSAKRFIVEEKAEKHGQAKDSGTTDEVDFSKGPIRCDRCGYNTNRYDHYLAHLKHHNKAGENERVYKCTICTYTTVSEYHWKKHLRNHFPRKVYTCSQCSYFSDRKNNYVQHIRTHTGERPYRCSMCPYSSSQKTHLTRHMRTHSGEKPFKCEQCSYVASNQHEVTRHARQVHDGPKPLACPHCDYKTADRSNFKKHVELHVSPRQFLCPVCDYAASKKCNLQYHIKSRHPDCCDITMDVSKVRLRTKKSEVNTSESISGDNKVEREPIKKESIEKKNERPVKEEKKENLLKEKKPASSAGVGQVTTRSRKTVAESKETNVKMTEKSGKTKKAKRKAEASSVPLKKELATDIDVIVKKKRKIEKKPSKCLDSQKGESNLEVAKKQSLKKNKKKKSQKSKLSKNNKKPDHEKISDDKPLTEESSLMQEEESKTSGSPCSEQQLVAPNDGESWVLPRENMQDQEPLLAKHMAKDMELQMEDQEVPMAEDETAKADSQNEVEIELVIIPETSSEDSNVTSEKETDVLINTLPDLAQEIQTKHTCEVEMVTNPDMTEEIEPMEICETDTVTTQLPEERSSTKELQAEDPTEAPSPELPEKLEQSTKASLVSTSSSGTVVNENQEMEEDEGIHSHDGSDISDNISEGSDDSGLNGARSVQEETNQKPSQEVAVAKATKENYVCIFCDRSFKKEGPLIMISKPKS
ncbi:RE1-silencing transcription factor isoform X2 [Hemicordylus capensis]|uniref:RE1-silencing transcription factor isoform X2 n=1 Tax=Hemicordylus capensis TaxID=884348 RepID=UPI00230268B5|nr:RE1-silencing transcription factor isoform X2 [Hemicordylus capensis]